MKPARWDSSEAPSHLSAAGVVAALVVLLALLPGSPAVAAADDAVQRIHAAELLLGDAAMTPVEGAPWQPQSLPDNWSLSRPGASGIAWYRMRFALPAVPQKPYAVLLPLVWKFDSLIVNGFRIANPAETEGSAEKNVGQPLLLVIPQRALHAGSNELLMRVVVPHNEEGAVSTISVGEAARLRPEYNRRTFLQVTGAQFATLLTGIIGAFVLVLWLRRRQESSYGIFGLALLLRASLGASLFFEQPPLPEQYWSLLTLIQFDLFQLLINLFVLRFAGWRWPKYERFLWAYAVLFAAFGYLVKVRGVDIPEYVHLVASDYVPVTGYTVVAVLAAWRRRSSSYVFLALTTLFVLLSFLYENLVPQALDLGPLWPYRFLPLYLVIGWALIDRFARSLNESERLNAELEQRVRDKHAELEQNYQRLRNMERQQAVVEERQRIMSDMHDGVGGQLISTLGLVEHGEASAADVAAALRECLDNLRLIIDSLEPIEDDLLPVLGNLRYRIDGRLKEQGIALDWQVRDLPRLSCLTPQNVLHVLRILQEAFANVLKHARASKISVETGCEADGKRVFIRVRDNGRGFVCDGQGRGLGNMRQRARTIGGDLDIQSSPSGTTLSLLLPVV
jgi:signal transduction histidine kinase